MRRSSRDGAGVAQGGHVSIRMRAESKAGGSERCYVALQRGGP